MELEHEIFETDVPDGPLVDFGLENPRFHPKLRVPSHFQRQVLFKNLGLSVVLTCYFLSSRVEIRKLEVESLTDKPVLTTDLTKLGLPRLLKETTYSVIPGSGYWVKGHRQAALEWSGFNHDEEFLAQLVWLEHVCQGRPRNTLMKYFEFPRSTCSLLLKRLRDEYGLPQEAPERPKDSGKLQRDREALELQAEGQAS
jgi:hypothetical protein